MSKTMFANPKAALGFAGVTIAIAIGASFAAGAFLPETAEPEEIVADTEISAAPAAPTAPVPQTAWADEDFADDWNASAVDSANGFASADASSEMEQPEFGDYSPSEITEPSAPQSSPGRERAAPSAGPRIISRAAPGVAPPRPPGAGTPGELLIED